MDKKIKLILATLILIVFAVSCGGNSSQNNSNSRTTYKECPDCEGEGYERHKCRKCYGLGIVEQWCSYCGGKGTKSITVQTQERISCGVCRGTGSIACSICNGYGYVTCHTCQGNGYHACALCKGSGVSTIFGSVDTCPRCNGRGAERCSMCNGNGRRSCSVTETCKSCWGSGASEVLPVERQENIDCDHCGSDHKEKAICVKCNVKGYVDDECSRCYGNGQIEVK